MLNRQRRDGVVDLDDVAHHRLGLTQQHDPRQRLVEDPRRGHRLSEDHRLRHVSQLEPHPAGGRVGDQHPTLGLGTEALDLDRVLLRPIGAVDDRRVQLLEVPRQRLDRAGVVGEDHQLLLLGIHRVHDRRHRLVHRTVARLEVVGKLLRYRDQLQRHLAQLLCRPGVDDLLPDLQQPLVQHLLVQASMLGLHVALDDLDVRRLQAQHLPLGRIHGAGIHVL